MKRSMFAGPYAVWMVLFTVAPLLFVVYFALTNASGAVTLENLTEFVDPIYLNVLWRSLYLAFYCTIICL
ncbi:MAG: ABC transporter permease, partial [Clostridia bacterium]